MGSRVYTHSPTLSKPTHCHQNLRFRIRRTQRSARRRQANSPSRSAGRNTSSLGSACASWPARSHTSMYHGQALATRSGCRGPRRHNKQAEHLAPPAQHPHLAIALAASDARYSPHIRHHFVCGQPSSKIAPSSRRLGEPRDALGPLRIRPPPLEWCPLSQPVGHISAHGLDFPLPVALIACEEIINSESTQAIPILKIQPVRKRILDDPNHFTRHELRGDRGGGPGPFRSGRRSSASAAENRCTREQCY